MDIKQIEKYIQSNLIESTNFLKEFSTLKATLLFSYQEPCFYQDTMYGDGEKMFSRKEFKELMQRFEEYY